MLAKPTVTATQAELLQFVHDWVGMCAEGKINEAFTLLDAPLDSSRYHWSAEDITEITFDHFDDGLQPVITHPDTVGGDIPLRADSGSFNDGSGYWVEFDLPMNGVVSDFTLMFEFLFSNETLKVILDDCHVM